MGGALAAPFAGMIGDKPNIHAGKGTEFKTLDELKKVIVAFHAEGPKLHTPSGIKSSFTPESSRETFDAKAFEEAQPAMAALYKKTVTRSGGATITAPRAKKG